MWGKISKRCVNIRKKRSTEVSVREESSLVIHTSLKICLEEGTCVTVYVGSHGGKVVAENGF
jgi:hypothetical protein